MRNLIGFISPHSGNLLAGGFVCLQVSVPYKWEQEGNQ